MNATQPLSLFRSGEGAKRIPINIYFRTGRDFASTHYFPAQNAFTSHGKKTMAAKTTQISEKTISSPGRALWGLHLIAEVV